MRLGGQEMAAAKQLLEHPEEVLDQPPQAMHLTDQLGGKIEAIRSNPQEAVGGHGTPLAPDCGASTVGTSTTTPGRSGRK